MGIKIKHTDPTLNSFSTDDLVVNVSEGSLFFKSNTELFRIKGDILSTTVTESFGNELWHRTGNNLYYTSGSVGIGTSAPLRTLEVAGNSAKLRVGPDYVTSQGSTDRDYIELQAGSTDTKIVSPNERFHIENTGGGGGDGHIILTAAGGVGIGSTAPENPLHLSGSSNTLIEVETSTDTTQAGIIFNTARTGAGMGSSKIYKLNSTTYFETDESLHFSANNRRHILASNGSTRFYSGSAAGGTDSTEYARFDHVNKRLGIGTNTPTETLHVVGNVKATEFHGDGSNLTNVSPQGITSLLVNGANNRIVTALGANTMDAEANFTFDDSTSYLYLNGKMGIGNATPSNRLQVSHTGADTDNGIIIVREDTSTADADLLGGIGFDSTDGNVPSSILEASAYIAAYAAEAQGASDKGGDLVFGTAPINQDDDTVSSERMRILDSGNVGIGTPTPSTKLQVDGTVTATAFAGDLTGDVTGEAATVATIAGLAPNTATTQATQPNITSVNGVNQPTRFTRAGINSSSYVMLCTVVGAGLASSIRISMAGTSSSVVVNSVFDILVNHSKDIMVKSFSGDYTEVTLRITSNNDEDFSIEAKHNGSTTTTLEVIVFPLNNETVTATETDPGYSGEELEFTATEGFRFGGVDNSTQSGLAVFDGSVGIGLSNPSRKLVVDIGTGAQSNEGIRIQGQNNGVLSFQNGTSTSDALYPLIYGQASSTLSSTPGVAGLIIRGRPPADNANNPAFIMRGQNQAYDGQSTASPIIRFQNYITDHFVIDFDGTLTGTDQSIGSLSDKRLKKNIENYQYDLEKFKQFKTKKFDWINPQEHGNKSQQIGFIAQDLEKIDPRWVKDYLVNIESPDTEFLDKDRMSKTTPLGQTDSMYISIIQQLIVKIENIEKEIKELKNGK